MYGESILKKLNLIHDGYTDYISNLAFSLNHHYIKS